MSWPIDVMWHHILNVVVEAKNVTCYVKNAATGPFIQILVCGSEFMQTIHFMTFFLFRCL